MKSLANVALIDHCRAILSNRPGRNGIPCQFGSRSAGRKQRGCIRPVGPRTAGASLRT